VAAAKRSALSELRIMKRTIIYLTVSITLLIVLLFRFELLYINVSRHNSYHLTDAEKTLIVNAISKFRERVDAGKFSEIEENLSKGRKDIYWEKIITKDIQNNLVEYGKPLSWEIFEVAQPQVDKVKGETHYHVSCLTKFEKEEIHESFIWSVKDNKEINLFFNGLGYPQSTNWRIEERNKQKVIVEKYPREIIIPYADRYIEIRY
jgi:hypothetical protein